MTNEEKQRTLKQNNALHKLFELYVTALNDAGYSVQVVLKKVPELSWSKYNFKELIWRRFQQAELGKNSTTELSTKDIDKIYDEVNRFLSEEFYITEPFPSIKEILMKQRMEEKR